MKTVLITIALSLDVNKIADNKKHTPQKSHIFLLDLKVIINHLLKLILYSG